MINRPLFEVSSAVKMTATITKGEIALPFNSSPGCGHRYKSQHELFRPLNPVIAVGLPKSCLGVLTVISISASVENAPFLPPPAPPPNCVTVCKTMLLLDKRI